MHALCDHLLAHPLPGVTDLYPGYVNLYVEFDSSRVTRPTVRGWVRRQLEGVAPEGVAPKPAGREVTIPTRYDGEDLAWVAAQTGFSPAEVIRRHSRALYRVYTVGFVPGQPMLGTSDQALYLPRRPTPRALVRANAVAVAVSQTTIYTLPTPGGWHLLGTALRTIYDPNRADPFLLTAGDSVRFVPADGPDPAPIQPLETLPTAPDLPVFRVEEPGLLDLIVDEGRFMSARFGMARSGWLDPRSARVANAVVGNSGNAPCLELTLRGPVLSLLRDAVIGFAGMGLSCQLDDVTVPMAQGIPARAGQRLSFTPLQHGARAYLSVAGGFAGTEFMGSRSPDLRGRVGRALRADDQLGLAASRSVRSGFEARVFARPEGTVTVRLMAGPQATPAALRALGSAEFTVVSLDRMGVRLRGPKVPGSELISEATPMGGVQITTEGDPILLLNDRGRIGGYAKPAVIHPDDLPLVAQLRPGQRLKFNCPANSSARHWFLQV